MRQGKLYHSSISDHGFRRAKTRKADSHNLRSKLNKDIKENINLELTSNNILYVEGKLVDPTQTEKYFKRCSAILDKERSDYVSKLKNNYGDDEKAKLTLERVECKKAIKRFIKSSEDLEKNFWQDIYDRVSNETFENSKNDIDTLKSFGKIKRLNNKKKRLEQLESFNGLIGDKTRNTAFTVFSKELLYKIPDDSKVNIKPENWIIIQNNIDRLLYPDFDNIYSVVHMDENPNNSHLHNRKSGLNKLTKEFDIHDQVMINLNKHVKNYPFKDKKWKDLNPDQVKEHGEIYQTFIFKKMNEYLKKMKIDVELVKTSPEEKAENSKKFLDKTRPIASREHNLQKKQKEINDKNKKVLNNQKLELNENDEKLEQQEDLLFTNNANIKKLESDKQNLNDDIDTLEKEKSFIQKTIEALKDPKKYLDKFINYAKNYNAFPNDEDLNSIKNDVNSINDIDTGQGRFLSEIAIELQNTEVKQNNVRRATQSDKSKRP